MSVSMPPPSVPPAPSSGAGIEVPPGIGAAAPLALQEIKPIRVDPHAHGIETENVSTGAVLKRILAEKAGGVQAADGSAFTLEDLESVQYDIDEAEAEIHDANGLPVRYERDETETLPDGSKVEHKQGEIKKQKGFSYQTFDHEGIPCIAIPVVCKAIVNRGGNKQTVEFVHTYYTRLEAPKDGHPTPVEQQDLKNKLMITLIHIRKGLTLDKLKDDSYNPGPTLIKGKLETDTLYISTGRGFTDEKKGRLFGHTRIRQEHTRFESEKFLGVEVLGYGTLGAIQQEEYQKIVLPDSPQRMPKDFATFPVVYRGPVSPSRDPDIKALHGKLDDLRRECAAYQAAHLASPSQPNPRKEAVQRALSDWRHAPPPDSAQEFVLQHTTEHALATMEHLTDIMQNTFSSAHVDPSTGKTEVTLIQDDIQQYQLLAGEVAVRERLNALQTELKPFQDKVEKAQSDIAANTKASQAKQKNLAALQPQLTAKRAEVQRLTAEIQAKRSAGAPPADITALEQKKQTEETALSTLQQQISSLQTEIQQFATEKTALDAALHDAQVQKETFENTRSPNPTDPSNKEKMEELKKQLNPRFARSPRDEKGLSDLRAQGRAQLAHLSDRLHLMEKLHETLQQDLDTRRTVEELYPGTQEDREIKADLMDALKKSEFGGMKGAIEAFKDMIGRLPPLPDQRPRHGMTLIPV